jgi:hypothetical protein
MTPAIVDKIRSRGHWRINFRPLSPPKKELTLPECRDLVDKNSVSLRGWNYPHVSNKPDGLRARTNSFEGCVDWHEHIEYWRMYQSTQFVHYVALDDDWTDVSHWRRGALEAGRFLEAIGGLFYEVGEIFAFLARLARSGLYATGAAVSIDLVGMEGRRLYLDRSSGRGGLRDEYVSAEPRIKFSAQLTPRELANTSDAAVKAATFIVQRFQWLDPADAVLQECVVDFMLGQKTR